MQDSQSQSTQSASPSASSSASLPTATSSEDRDFSETGAFNGTGVNLADALIGNDISRLYFQHYTGEIRETFVQSNSWVGGSDQNVVVGDNIRNATPIAAVSYWEGRNTTVG